MRKCAVPNCTKYVEDEYPRKWCPSCLKLARLRNKKYNSSEKGKATAKKNASSERAKAHDKSEKRKQSKKDRWHSEEAKIQRQDPEWQARRKIARDKYRNSPHGHTVRMEEQERRRCKTFQDANPELYASCD